MNKKASLTGIAQEDGALFTKGLPLFLIDTHLISKLSLVFVPPDKATGSTLCVVRGQLCRESSVGIQATEEMTITIGRRVHVTSE